MNTRLGKQGVLALAACILAKQLGESFMPLMTTMRDVQRGEKQVSTAIMN